MSMSILTDEEILSMSGNWSWSAFSHTERTSVERCNSRLKEYLVTNDLHVRGI